MRLEALKAAMADVDITTDFYNKVGCVASLTEVEEKEYTKEDGAHTSWAFKFLTEGELVSMSGKTLPKGSTLTYRLRFRDADTEGMNRRLSDVKRLAVALRKLLPSATDVEPVTAADVGKRVSIWLTHSKSKTNPDGDGFQNWAFRPVKE